MAQLQEGPQNCGEQSHYGLPTFDLGLPKLTVNPYSWHLSSWFIFAISDFAFNALSAQNCNENQPRSYQTNR